MHLKVFLLALIMLFTPQTLACKTNYKRDNSMYQKGGVGVHGLDVRNKKYGTGCPDYTDLPTHHKGKRIAACFWPKNGHRHPLRACNGNPVCIQDDTHRIEAKKKSAIPIGSMVIAAGCEMGYLDKEDNTHTFEGPRVETGVSWKPWNNAKEIRLICHKTPAFDCHTNNLKTNFTDRWDTIAIFNNSDSSDEGEFEYTHAIGMSFTDEESSKFFREIAVSIGGSLGLEVKEISIAEVSAETSVVTGYDWKKTSTIVRNDKRVVQAKVFVPAGQVLELQQIIGVCPGAFTAHTEVIKAITNPPRLAQPTPQPKPQQNRTKNS